MFLKLDINTSDAVLFVLENSFKEINIYRTNKNKSSICACNTSVMYVKWRLLDSSLNHFQLKFCNFSENNAIQQSTNKTIKF